MEKSLNSIFFFNSKNLKQLFFLMKGRTFHKASVNSTKCLERCRGIGLLFLESNLAICIMKL